MSTTVRVAAAAAILVVLAQLPAAAQQSTQDPEAQKRLQSVSDQRSIKLSPGQDVLVKIGPKGPAESPFQTFDRPFPLREKLCEAVAAGTGTARDPKCGLQDRKVVFQFLTDPAMGRATVRIVGATASEAPPIALTAVPTATAAPAATTANSFLATDLERWAGSDKRVDLLISVDDQPVGAVSFTFADTPVLRGMRANTMGMGNELIVWLDRTGVASPEFLNLHWPVFIGPTDPASASILDDWKKRTYLVFRNRIGDRQFIVTFSNIEGDNRWRFLDKELQLSDCDPKSCSAVLVVPAGGERKIPASLLWDAFVNQTTLAAPTISFDISLFHDDAQLANPKGYFSLVQYNSLVPAPSASKWRASVLTAFGWTPDLSNLQAAPTAKPVISDRATRGAINDDSFNGAVRLGLQQSLSARVKGEFEIRLKNGTFGSDAKVEATKYRLDSYGYRGVVYSAGLFDVAEPSEGIALSESGENVGFHYRWIDANYLVRQYVPRQRHTALDFKEKEAAGGHSALLFQFRGVPGLTWTRGSIDLYGLVGRKDTTRCVVLVDGACPPKPEDVSNPPPAEIFQLSQWYDTTGADLNFAFHEGWTASAAIYHSRLRVDDRGKAPYATARQLRNDTGHGTVGLVTVGWTRFAKPKAPAGAAVNAEVPALFTVRGQFGAGTGNEAETATNHAYLGETASYAPDLLFLSLFAPRIQTSRGEVGSGLANKQYVGLLFTTAQYSPLSVLAKKFFRVPDGDMSGTTTTIKWHDYRMVHWADGLSHHAGHEFDVAFALESPAKATYSVALAGFWPGKALSGPMTLTNADGSSSTSQLIRGFQWSAVARLTVTM